MVDEIALGREDSGPATASSLWCAPGAGYSYATASIHLASIMLRHITGMELETLALGGRVDRSPRRMSNTARGSRRTIRMQAADPRGCLLNLRGEQ